MRHSTGALKKMARKVGLAVQSFGLDAVCLAIERYSRWLANPEGRYRKAYHWTLGEFVSRQDGYNVIRLSGDSWEQVCLQFGSGASQVSSPGAQGLSGSDLDTPWGKWAKSGKAGA